jgi:peptidoglycan/xylan/chitin deacetylase (PgdA/CDA1 family)
MNLKRQALYFSYRALRKFGILSGVMNFSSYASIIMCHRVNNYDFNELTTPTTIFEELLSILSAEYRVIPLNELIISLMEKRTIEPRTVVLTFDDGYQDNFLIAAPLLKKYNLPATFFVTSGYVGTDKVFPWDLENRVKNPLMSWDMVRELVKMGFEIGGHTVNHVNLGVVPIDEAFMEISGCKADIEYQIGKDITSFAYPFGDRNAIRPEIYSIIDEAGFHCCCSGYGGKNYKKADIFNLLRSPTYPSTIEILMDLDGFMTYFDKKMKIEIFQKKKASLIRSLMLGN